MFRAMGMAGLACVLALPADAPLVPLTVCEVLRDLPAQEGKDIAVLGRFSFREQGRSIHEQECDPAIELSPPQLWLSEDNNSGPRPPANFEFDGVAVARKLLQIKRRTTLGKFRFGNPDYDRWAVIYGKVEARKGEDAKRAPANLVYRGSGVIYFLQPQ